MDRAVLFPGLAPAKHFQAQRNRLEGPLFGLAAAAVIAVAVQVAFFRSEPAYAISEVFFIASRCWRASSTSCSGRHYPADRYASCSALAAAMERAEIAATEFLAHVGTRDVVKDMDVIRAVLGDKQLTSLGISYGTQLGATYAETFPRNVRALVLDGTVDPAQKQVDAIVAQNSGFQKAFDAFAADCAKFEKGPLGNPPELAVNQYRTLLAPLLHGSAPRIRAD